ncbi:hypothetical protein HMPREF1992_01843 [Selenomonas sp. oral taxon 892 str. F0426]|nr:hypothetical protein HMPREF1992_01843 [Selenomonas sp. oral taxon 892 str. F0426]
MIIATFLLCFPHYYKEFLYIGQTLIHCLSTAFVNRSQTASADTKNARESIPYSTDHSRAFFA